MRTYVVIPSIKRGDAESLVSMLDAECFVIENDGPLNLSKKWNHGLDLAAGTAWLNHETEWNVAILNDDLKVGPDFLGLLGAGLRSRKDIGVTYPNIEHPLKVGEVGRTQGDGGDGRTLTGWAFMLRGEEGFRFDEQFEWWYGDSDLEKQVRASGRWAAAVGGCEAVHLNATQSTRGELLQVAKDDEARFAKKWQLDPESLFLAQNKW